MPELKVEVTPKDIVDSLVMEEIVTFIADIADRVEGYGYDFRDMVIKRLEADK